MSQQLTEQFGNSIERHHHMRFHPPQRAHAELHKQSLQFADVMVAHCQIVQQIDSTTA